MKTQPATPEALAALEARREMFAARDARIAKKVSPAQRRALAALRPLGTLAARGHWSTEAPSFHAPEGSPRIVCRTSTATLWALVDQGLLSDRKSDKCGLGMGCKRWCITSKGRRIHDLIAG